MTEVVLFIITIILIPTLYLCCHYAEKGRGQR